MKLAIVVGHNSVSQGAVRRDTNETEYVWNSQLARLISQFSDEYGFEVKLFFRQPGAGYSREIAQVYEEVDRWGAEASIELHFNSHSDDGATGTETLTSGTPLSMSLATEVNAEMVRSLGLRDRGVKTRSTPKQGRGYKSLIAGRCPAILIEPFFGSSEKGQRATDEQHEKVALAHAILRGAHEAMSRFPRSSLKDSRTMIASEKLHKKINLQKGTSVLTGISTAATAAKDEIATLPAIGPLADWLPYITLGLIAVTFATAAMARKDTEAVEEARMDDFQAQLR